MYLENNLTRIDNNENMIMITYGITMKRKAITTVIYQIKFHNL